MLKMEGGANANVLKNHVRSQLLHNVAKYSSTLATLSPFRSPDVAGRFSLFDPSLLGGIKIREQLLTA